MLRALGGRVPERVRLFDDPVAERLLTGVPTLVVRNRPLRWTFVRLMGLAAPGFFGWPLATSATAVRER